MDSDKHTKFDVINYPSYSHISSVDWDNCANSPNPFISHRFLLALEDSGCTSSKTGWSPFPIVLKSKSGDIIAASPLYIKSHSYGEYVFDQSWADAFTRAGGDYYPKIQVSSPFTPVTGPRILSAQGPNQKKIIQTLSQGIKNYTEKFSLSSAHITFCTESEWNTLTDLGYLPRTSEQFHWINEGYKSFEDFLGSLSSRKRKAIRKERFIASKDGDISFQTLEGGDITESDWDDFFHFYLDTSERKWGSPYLNRDFFSLAGERMSNDIILILAKYNKKTIAGALNFIGGGILYGRYWGCENYFPSLHFEICYYQAIDYAITKGLIKIEAGAQGAHKIARGYQPIRTYSAHWISNPTFREAVANYLNSERKQVENDIMGLRSLSPFRNE